MENTQERETERIEAAPDQGLSRSQVAQRIAAGLDHKKIDVQTKSYGRIFRDNLCTLFNLLNVALAAAVLLVGSYRNALFILIILCNIAIGTFQEIRAKRTVDRLSLLSEPKAHVVREGKEETISIQETVLDDILSCMRETRYAQTASWSWGMRGRRIPFDGRGGPGDKTPGRHAAFRQFYHCGKLPGAGG